MPSFSNLLGVRQSLSLRCANRGQSPVTVRHGAAVMPELELSKIAVKVLLADTVIDAVETATEHPEETFDAVGMHRPAHIFALGVTDGFMATLELFADTAIA